MSPEYYSQEFQRKEPGYRIDSILFVPVKCQSVLEYWNFASYTLFTVKLTVRVKLVV